MVGYVSGEVFPIIQNIDKFTMKATTPDSKTKPCIYIMLNCTIHTTHVHTRADMVISNGKESTGSKNGTIIANISEDSGALKRIISLLNKCIPVVSESHKPDSTTIA